MALTTFTSTTTLAWASTSPTATTSNNQNKPPSLQLTPVHNNSTTRSLFPITKWLQSISCGQRDGLRKKTILGWLWDFWQLTISLPHNKFIAWSGEICKMINERLVTTKELESSIGRLTYILMIIPFVHHFLNCLCELHLRSKRNNRHRTGISQLCIDDLKLMETCFLGRLTGGKHE